MKVWFRAAEPDTTVPADGDAGDVESASVKPPVEGTWTAADETARGLWSRAASGARTNDPSFSPLMFAAMGSDLVTRGESHWLWFESRWWRIDGEAIRQPSDLIYVTLPLLRSLAESPVGLGDRARTLTIDRRWVASVWWDAAMASRRADLTSTRRALASVEKMLADEFDGPRGSLLTYPAGGKTPLAALRAALLTLAGGLRLVRSGQAGYGDRSAVSSQWLQTRIGASPPVAVVTLGSNLHNQTLQAYSIPPGLWRSSTQAPREAWRFFLASSVRPTVRLFLADCARVLGLRLDESLFVSFSALEDADLQPKARAFKALRDGGMEVAEARRVVGL